mmetsp:Transcript_2543/g.7019  ORF Transcript_2543/g.7019 Transcript_2543/m.7019 type:complete len:210 (+) Transcript_2543:494-1123(+)
MGLRPPVHLLRRDFLWDGPEPGGQDAVSQPPLLHVETLVVLLEKGLEQVTPAQRTENKVQLVGVEATVLERIHVKIVPLRVLCLVFLIHEVLRHHLDELVQVQVTAVVHVVLLHELGDLGLGGPEAQELQSGVGLLHDDRARVVLIEELEHGRDLLNLSRRQTRPYTDAVLLQPDRRPCAQPLGLRADKPRLRFRHLAPVPFRKKSKLA